MIQWAHPQWASSSGSRSRLLWAFMLVRYERRPPLGAGAIRRRARRHPSRTPEPEPPAPTCAGACAWLRSGLLSIAAAGPPLGPRRFVAREHARARTSCWCSIARAAWNARATSPPSPHHRGAAPRRSRCSTTSRAIAWPSSPSAGDAGRASRRSPSTCRPCGLLIESLGTERRGRRRARTLGKGPSRLRSRWLPEARPTRGEQAIVLFTGRRRPRGPARLRGRASPQRPRGEGVPRGLWAPPAGRDDPRARRQRARQIGVKMDASGAADPEPPSTAPALADLAHRHGRARVHGPAPGAGSIASLRAAVASVGRGARQGRLGSRPMERFLGFALLGWVCLVASWLLPERRALRGAKAKESRRAGFDPRRGAARGPCWWACSSWPRARAGAGPSTPLVDGNRRYEAGRRERRRSRSTRRR